MGVDKTTNNVNSLGLVDIRYGKQIESIKGVEKVSPFLVSGATVRFANGKTTPVVILGSQSPRFVGGAWNIQNGKLTDLLKDGAVMIDYFDKAIQFIQPPRILLLGAVMLCSFGFILTNYFLEL